MPDPKGAFSERNSNPDGVGPYDFIVGEDIGNGDLQAGDSEILNLREYEENGTVGYYTVLSEAGYDNIMVENQDSGNNIRVNINEVGDLSVPANTIQSNQQKGMYRFEVKNVGSTTIASGDIILTIKQSGYGANEAARARLSESPLKGFLRSQFGL